MALRASTASVGRADCLVSDVNIYHTRKLPNSCVNHSGEVGTAHFCLGQIILLPPSRRLCLRFGLFVSRIMEKLKAPFS